MSIIRVSKNKENPYVMINKTALTDPNISYKAKGIFAYLMSKPDDWNCQVKDLMKQAKDGRDSIYNGLKELREHGYLIKRAIKNEIGAITEYEELLFEVPQEHAKVIYQEQKEINDKAAIKRAETIKKKKELENPLTENPEAEEATSGKSVSGKSVSGKPGSIINKELLNKELLNNEYIERENACARDSQPGDNVDNVDKVYKDKLKELFIDKAGIDITNKQLNTLAEFYNDDAGYTISKMNEFKLREGRSWSYFVSLYNTPKR